jgi:hypothetical protein
MANRVLIGKSADNTTHGVFVSRYGVDVLDPTEAIAGNLAFDTSNYPIGSLRVLQRGTFTNLTCTKQFFSKKGPTELLSDESNRANTSYVKNYPWDLDNAASGDDIGSAADHIFNKRTNTGDSIFGKDAYLSSSGMGNPANLDYVQNVYCDYATRTFEFEPKLPSNKSPYITVFFALANSSGHFHPWYANVDCTPGQEDYSWQYANSEQCVHMDSAWFRGKWAYRQRMNNQTTEDFFSYKSAIEIPVENQLHTMSSPPKNPYATADSHVVDGRGSKPPQALHSTSTKAEGMKINLGEININDGNS